MVNVCWAEFTYYNGKSSGPSRKPTPTLSNRNPTFGGIELIPHNAQIVNDCYAKDCMEHN